MTDAYHRIMNPLWPFIGKMYRHPIHTGVVVAMSAGVIAPLGYLRFSGSWV